MGVKLTKLIEEKLPKPEELVKVREEDVKLFFYYSYLFQQLNILLDNLFKLIK